MRKHKVRSNPVSAGDKELLTPATLYQKQACMKMLKFFCKLREKEALIWYNYPIAKEFKSSVQIILSAGGHPLTTALYKAAGGFYEKL